MAYSGPTPEQVFLAGYDTWSVFLNNWGNLGANADANSNNFPVQSTQGFVIPSCAAIGVNAASPVGSFGVEYQVLDSTSPSTVLKRNTRVSAESPLMFPVSSPINIFSDQDIKVGDTYFKNNATVASAFPATFVSGLARPTLIIDFYFRRPMSIPSMRAPTISSNTVVMVGGGEQTAALLTIDKRRSVKVVARVTGATAVATIRAGLIYLSGGAAPGMEVNMAAPVVGAVDGQVVTFTVDKPEAALVALYYDLTAGAGSLNLYIESID